MVALAAAAPELPAARVMAGVGGSATVVVQFASGTLVVEGEESMFEGEQLNQDRKK